MARPTAFASVLAAVVVLTTVPGGAEEPQRGRVAATSSRGARALLAKRKQVANVTVTIPAKSCAGSFVGSPSQVLTAAHCIPEGLETLDVLFQGRVFRAMVALIDRERDTALLALEEPPDVVPLELEGALPERGERVLFVGRVDRRSRVQVAQVERLGRCPSLPSVTDAVFTTIQARPGDSGAPILNDRLRVVGVIHGGAACHIAASTAALAQELARLGRAGG